MLPAVTPSIIGVSIFISPPNRLAVGSSGSSSGAAVAAGADSAAASFSKSGRYASIV